MNCSPCSTRLASRRSLLTMLSITLTILLLFVVAGLALDNGQDANRVLGQLDFISSAGGVSATQMNGPRGVAVDPTTGKVFVCDTNNNRVLRFASWGTLANGQAAEGVLGQPSFNTNDPGTSQTAMKAPAGAHVDNNGRLWVADTGNHRVLRFNDASAKGNGAAADGVLGQGDFVSGIANRGGMPIQEGMSSPTSVFVEPDGVLWVADTNNHRVLRFVNAAFMANGDPATGVQGQDDFDFGAPNRGGTVNQNTMSSPTGVYADADRRLWVADSQNHRVLRFDEAYLLGNGENAAAVLGQPDFITAIPDITRRGFKLCGGVAGNSSGDLYVHDTGNNRILVFVNAHNKNNGGAATNVLGQVDFMLGLPNRGGLTNANTLKSSDPSNLFFDNEAEILWAPDNGNNRVLAFKIIAPAPPPDDHSGGCFVGVMK